MFDNILKFLKKMIKKEEKSSTSKDTAKERLHLVLLQDRANVSADFLDMMKQEIIEVIKKYIEIDESAIDVRLTNKENSDGTNGAPALYANIPIVNIKDETRKMANKDEKVENKDENKDIITEKIEENKDSELEEKIEEKDIKEDVDVDNKEPQDKEGQANKEESQEKAEENKEENVNE